MALQHYGTFLDGALVVSLDVVSNNVAGVSVVNSSGKTAEVVCGPASAPTRISLTCPTGQTTASATLATGQRFPLATNADWRLGCSTVG